MEYRIDDTKYPPVVESTSKEILKYFWSKTNKVGQDDLDYFNDVLLRLYYEAQRMERIERRRVEELKREKSNK